MSTRSSSPASVTSEYLDDRERAYVFGITPGRAFPTLVVVSPSSDGWAARSTDRSYNHDYICFEDLGEIMEWIDGDLQRTFIAKDRQEALDTLTAKHNGSEHRLGFLYPGDVSSGSIEEADTVLRHLERGW